MTPIIVHTKRKHYSNNNIVRNQAYLKTAKQLNAFHWRQPKGITED